MEISLKSLDSCTNDQFVGKRKLKDHWGDEVYTVCNQVNVPVYVIENQ